MNLSILKGLKIAQWLPWALLALVGVLIGSHVYALYRGIEIGKADGKVALEAEHAAASKKLADALAEARANDQRLSYELMQVSTEAWQRQQSARDDLVAAADAGGQLQERATQLAASCGAVVDDTAAVYSRDAADAAGRMLAVMLSRMETNGRAVAEFADSAHIAGGACERTRESLTTAAGTHASN